MPAYILQQEEVFAKALPVFEKHAMDFSDCLIYAVTEKEQTLPLYTFDKKLLALAQTFSP